MHLCVWKTLRSCSVSLLLFALAHINPSSDQIHPKNQICSLNIWMWAFFCRNWCWDLVPFHRGHWVWSEVWSGSSPNIPNKSGARLAGSCSVVLPGSWQALSWCQSCQCRLQGALPTLAADGCHCHPPTELPPAPWAGNHSPLGLPWVPSLAGFHCITIALLALGWFSSNKLCWEAWEKALQIHLLSLWPVLEISFEMVELSGVRDPSGFEFLTTGIPKSTWSTWNFWGDLSTLGNSQFPAEEWRTKSAVQVFSNFGLPKATFFFSCCCYRYFSRNISENARERWFYFKDWIQTWED